MQPLTHAFLSIMLGVRWPGMMEALQALREQGLISGKRIERTAGEAYGAPEAEYRRLIR